MLRFSVVIPTYERPDDLERCLKSLGSANQTIEEDFEILVSDDSISADSRRLVRSKFPSVSWDEGKKNGQRVIETPVQLVQRKMDCIHR